MKKTTKITGRRAKSLKKVAKRLAAYSAAAAATVVASQDRSADAANVSWPGGDVSVGANPGLLFNMVNGNIGPAAASAGNANSFRLIGNYNNANSYAYLYTPSNNALLGGFVGTGTSYAANLGPGAVVDGNLNFVGDPGFPSYGIWGYLPASNFGVGTPGFVGIRFLIGGDTHYGWAEISRGVNAEATLHSFGYNTTPDEAALTGAIPEPSSILLFAVGAAGLAMRRRRRKAV
jgi:hypothetical protein